MGEPSPQNSCLPKAPFSNLQEESVETVSDRILPCSKLFLRWLLELGTVPALLCVMKDRMCVPHFRLPAGAPAMKVLGGDWTGRREEASARLLPLRCPALRLQQWPPCPWDRPWLPTLVGPLLPAVLPAQETKSTFCPCYCLGLPTVPSFPFGSGALSHF